MEVAHAGGDAGGQVVELAHLRAGGHEQGLLRTAAGHGASAQVRDEGPGAEDRRGAGLERVDVAQSGQHLGHRLHDRSRQGRGRGRPRLARREEQHRHAAGDGDLQAAAGILREAQRRHDEAAGEADEWPGPPRSLAAGHQMEDLEAGIQRVAAAEAGADMLGGAGDAGIERVEVQLHRAHHVAWNQGALEEMDMVQGVDDPGRIVEIPQERFAIFPGLQVDHVHGRSGRAEMHLAAPRLQVVPRLLPEQGEASRGTGDHVLDQGPRETQPPVLVDVGAASRAGLDAGGQRLRHAQPFEHVERCRMDGADLPFAKGTVAAAFEPGADRSQRLFQGCGPELPPCLAPAAAPAIAGHRLAPLPERPIVAAAQRSATETSCATGELASPIADAMLRP